MNKSHHQLLETLTECLQAKLSGLSEKHTKKMQKPIANAAKKLVRKYAKLEAKARKGNKKAKPLAALPTAKKAVLRAVKAVPQPATAKRLAPTAPSPRRKTAPTKVATEA